MSIVRDRRLHTGGYNGVLRNLSTLLEIIGLFLKKGERLKSYCSSSLAI